MPPDPARLDSRGMFNEDFNARIKATNANVIRIAVHPERWIQDLDYLWRHIDPIVNWAGELGMCVIIDWHYIGNIATGAGSEMPDSWEWATREERKILVKTMIQEAGCDVGTKRIVWVKVNPDYEILIKLMDGLTVDTCRRYWINDNVRTANIRDIRDIKEELGQMVTEVEIVLPMSHNTLTRAEEYI